MPRDVLYREERNGYLFVLNINYYDRWVFPYMIHIYRMNPPHHMTCVYYQGLRKRITNRSCKIRFTKFLKGGD